MRRVEGGVSSNSLLSVTVYGPPGDVYRPAFFSRLLRRGAQLGHLGRHERHLFLRDRALGLGLGVELLHLGDLLVEDIGRLGRSVKSLAAHVVLVHGDRVLDIVHHPDLTLLAI